MNRGGKLGGGGPRARPLSELVTTKKKFGKKTFDFSGLAASKELAEKGAAVWRAQGFEARTFKLPRPIHGQGKNEGKIARYAVYAR